MAKNIYLVTISKVQLWSAIDVLKNVKANYEKSGWNGSYFKKDGNRYLVMENPVDGEKRIFSYDSKMGMKLWLRKYI